MSDLIAALDSALAAASGETIVLRRVIGTLPNQSVVDVACIAKVTVASVERTEAGRSVVTYEIIMSPTQIREAQWPGGVPPQPEPFNPDASLPRAGLTDKVLLRGLPPCEVSFVNPIKVNGEVVRIEMKTVG